MPYLKSQSYRSTYFSNYMTIFFFPFRTLINFKLASHMHMYNVVWDYTTHKQKQKQKKTHTHTNIPPHCSNLTLNLLCTCRPTYNLEYHHLTSYTGSTGPGWQLPSARGPTLRPPSSSLLSPSKICGNSVIVGEHYYITLHNLSAQKGF